MAATVNTEIGGAAIGGQGGGGGAVDSVNGQTGVVVLTASDVGAAANSFVTLAVSGQSNVVADSAADTLTLAAGTGVAITTNASTDTITITNSAPMLNTFSTIAVSGQSDVVADSTADTLTFAAGSGITLTTNASTDTVTIAASTSGGITLVASQATTSGTTVTFTGIPSTAKRIAFMIMGVSISAGASSPPPIIQLGISSGLETSGYNGVTVFQSASVDRLNWTSGIPIDTTAGAGAVYYGKVYIDLAVASSNTWAVNGVVANPSSSSSFIGGTKALAGTLDRVAIVAPAGTTFDLGSVSISYE